MIHPWAPYASLFTVANALVMVIWLALVIILLRRIIRFVHEQRAISRDRKGDDLQLSLLSQYALFMDRMEGFEARIRLYYARIKSVLRILFECSLLLAITLETLLSYEVIANPGLIVFAQISSKLAMSYISAFLFYFVVAHWQRQADKEHIQDHVGPLLHDIFLETVHMFEPVTRAHDQSEEEVDVFKLSRLEVLHSLETYDVDARMKDTPWNGDPVTVQRLIHYHVDRIKEMIRGVLAHYTLLDAELISILQELQSQRLLKDDFAFIERMKPSYLAEDLWTFRRCVKMLGEYAERYPGKKVKFPPPGESDERMREMIGPIDFDELGIKHDPHLHWKVRRILRRMRNASKE